MFFMFFLRLESTWEKNKPLNSNKKVQIDDPYTGAGFGNQNLIFETVVYTKLQLNHKLNNRIWWFSCVLHFKTTWENNKAY